MAENKKGFLLYADQLSIVKKLVEKDRENNTNYGGELFLHLLEYVNDKDPIPINFIIEMSFEPIKLQLKRDLKKYQAKTVRNSENGREGGLKSAEARRLKKELEGKNIVTTADVKNEMKKTVANNPTFFYIGTTMYKTAVSEYVRNELQTHSINMLLKYKPITLDQVLKQMDEIYPSGHPFSGHSHVIKAFNKVLRELKEGKTNKKFGLVPTAKTSSQDFS